MKITFLCPIPINTPVGGVKVVIEFANRLVRRGHEVTVVAALAGVPFDITASLPQKFKRLIWFVLRYIGYKGGYKPNQWITLEPTLKIRWLPSLDAVWIPNADAVIATAWETAEWVATYPDTKGRKFYLIQNDESKFDQVDAQRVRKTWSLPMKKMVTGSWLQGLLAGENESTCWVSQGVDYQDKKFQMMTPPEERNPKKILMMYHVLTWKGSADGLAALKIVKEKIPDITATLFGVPPATAELPDWIEYVRNPSQTELNKLYNSAAIFISPSYLEGMSLPPMEAMQCGAALCVTDIGGHRDYAVHEKTALLSPPANPQAMAENIIRLIEHQDVRIQLARNAHQFVQQFTWEQAVLRFENSLCISS